MLTFHKQTVRTNTSYLHYLRGAFFLLSYVIHTSENKWENGNVNISSCSVVILCNPTVMSLFPSTIGKSFKQSSLPWSKLVSLHRPLRFISCIYIYRLPESWYTTKSLNVSFETYGVIRAFSYHIVGDRLCGLVVRVPGYTTELYCASCEVRTEFIYVM
jgi:hypothetical protein